MTAVVATLAGCCGSRERHTDWWLGDVVVAGNHCRPVAGKLAVLELYDFGCSLPLPVCGGSRVFLITSQDHLAPGTTITLPSPAVRGVHCSLGEGEHATELELAGAIRVLENRGLDRRVELNARAKTPDWQEHRTLWFVRQGRPSE